MPNGKPGDHPYTDIFVHGRHPFPMAMEALFREAYELDPEWDEKLPFVDGMDWHTRFMRWASGEDLESGRRQLVALVAQLRAAARD